MSDSCNGRKSHIYIHFGFGMTILPIIVLHIRHRTIYRTPAPDSWTPVYRVLRNGWLMHNICQTQT
jgi:hypothetical protein